METVFYKNILRLCAKREISPSYLAKTLKFSSSTPTAWSKGSVPFKSTLQKIADYFGVTVDELLSESPLPKNITPIDRIVSFQEIGSICAGYNGSVDNEYTGRNVELPASMLHGLPQDEYFVLRVKGSSMYPKLEDGDSILVRRCETVESGAIAVILYNGDEATVKKVNYRYGEDWLELQPINPEYETKRISGADLQYCRVLGKVVSLVRLF